MAGAMQETIKAAAHPGATAGRASAEVEELEDGDSTWSRREAARTRQIMIGKARPEYRRYLSEVPLDTRGPSEPSTPDPRARVSKRKFDRALGEWRRRLHEFDGSPGEGRPLGGGQEAGTTSRPSQRRGRAAERALAAARALDALDDPSPGGGGEGRGRGGDAGSQEGGVVRLRLADQLPEAGGAVAGAPRRPGAQAAARGSQDPATPARTETRRTWWEAHWEGIAGTAEKATPPPSLPKAQQALQGPAAAPPLVAALAAAADTPEKDLGRAWRCSPGAGASIQDVSGRAAAGRQPQWRGPLAREASSPGSRGGSPRRRGCQSPRTPTRPMALPAATPERHPFLVTETPSPKQHYHHHFAQMQRGVDVAFATSHRQAYSEYSEYEVSTSHVPWGAGFDVTGSVYYVPEVYR